MKKSTKELIENGLLFAVVGGTIIAIQTQQLAWGLIPTAIALFVNKWSRKQEQHQLHQLENLIEKSQTEQENQQLSLWDLKHQLENLHQSQIAENPELIQLKTIREKQNHLERQLENLTQTKQRLETELKRVSQQQKDFSQTVSLETLDRQSPSQEQINRLRKSLKQMTQLLNFLAQRQMEQNNDQQKVTEEIKQEFHKIQAKYQRLEQQFNDQPVAATSQSSMQKQINELQQSLTEITEFLTSIAQRQVEENQALGRKLNQLQRKLNQSQIQTDH